MKKAFIYLVCLVICFTIVSCSSKTNSDKLYFDGKLTYVEKTGELFTGTSIRKTNMPHARTIEIQIYEGRKIDLFYKDSGGNITYYANYAYTPNAPQTYYYDKSGNRVSENEYWKIWLQ